MYKKLSGLLKEYDGILITSPYNMQYFSGFSGGEGAVLITESQKILFTDSRYTEAAQKETKSFDVIERKGFAELYEKIADIGIKGLVIEDNYMTAADSERIKAKTNIELFGKGNEIDRLRMVKESWEIEKIAQAEEIGDKAFTHILNYIKDGIAERDIAAELEYFMKKQGADKTSFDTIAISGKKTSMPHGKPDGKKIEKGDFVTLDFGCVYEGYCSDMTRTVVLGKANDRQKEIYSIVYEAQLAGLEAIKRGTRCCDADKRAREIIEKAGYGKYFGHSLGHGVGLLIHELPNLSPRCDVILEDNMVVSCEPGIYIPDFGGVRIEDLVCVTGEKCRILSKSTKKLTEI